MQALVYRIFFILFLLLPCFAWAETFTVSSTVDEKEVSASFEMIKIPGKKYFMGKTEVTCELYEIVMGKNPSSFAEEQCPVNNVSWYDCLVFCNRLSLMLGKKPVYSVNFSVNPDDWDYSPHGGSSIQGKILQNPKADGFRLSTEEEWEFAAKGGQTYKYPGGDNLDEFAWFKENSDFKLHKVAEKSPNAFGLYDMSGNVWEWCWNLFIEDSECYRIHKGGSCASGKELCEIKFTGRHYASRSQPCYSYCTFGLRIARNL